MRVDTWMPLYVSDYLADTAHLSTEEHGAYLLLIMHAWMNSGELPDDDLRLRRIARMDERPWKASRAVLRAFFNQGQGVLRHTRVDAELERAKAHVQQRSDAGKASAARRKAEREGNGRSTPVGTNDATKSATDGLREGIPSPSPVNPHLEIPSTTTTPSPPGQRPALSSSDLSDRAKTLAAMLNGAEQRRGKKANAFATDPRIQQWAASGVTDPQFREAYDMAMTQREESGEAAAAINAGFLDVFIAKLLNPVDKSSAVTASAKAWHESAQGIEAKGLELGVPPPDPLTGGFPAFKARVFKAAGMPLEVAA